MKNGIIDTSLIRFIIGPLDNRVASSRHILYNESNRFSIKFFFNDFMLISMTALGKAYVKIKKEKKKEKEKRGIERCKRYKVEKIFQCKQLPMSFYPFCI